MRRGRTPLTARVWRRIQVLLLLGDGETVRATAAAVGGYPREISRAGKRYLHAGLEHALGEDPRPKPAPKLDSTQQAAVVAMVCGPPPQGRTRWTLRLLAQEASSCGIVDTVGYGTIRMVLGRHDLKPWREKMWCVPEIDQEFVTDVANCGSCGVACFPGDKCTGGKCTGTVTCPTGFMNCGNHCVNTTTDIKNCGACGTACPPAQPCRLGVCSRTRARPWGAADGFVVDAERAWDGVRLRVRDEGPGVPAEIRGRIFEALFTTKPAGSGLGLALCRHILEAHGGSVALEDSAAGASFVVSLPALATVPAGSLG